MDAIVLYLTEYSYYIALFGAALMEGPVASFVAGSMVALGHLTFGGAFAVLVFKDLIMDSVFYGIGRFATIPMLAKRAAKFRGSSVLGAGVIESIETGWREHPAKFMWIGKLAYGLAGVFLVSAGMAGLSLKKFYLYSLPVMVFQYTILLAAGYFLGEMLGEFTGWIFWAQLVVGAAAFALMFQVLGRSLRKKYVQQK